MSRHDDLVDTIKNYPDDWNIGPEDQAILLAALDALTHRYAIYVWKTHEEDEFPQQAPSIYDIWVSANEPDVAIKLAEGYLASQDDFENCNIHIVDQFTGNRPVWNSDKWKIDHSPHSVFFSMEDVIERVGLTRNEKFWLSQLTWDDVRPVINQPDGVRLFKAYLTEYIEVRDQPVIKL